jgi:hypothetical protein
VDCTVQSTIKDIKTEKKQKEKKEKLKAIPDN